MLMVFIVTVIVVTVVFRRIGGLTVFNSTGGRHVERASLGGIFGLRIR
jgi:hypothetical protein